MSSVVSVVFSLVRCARVCLSCGEGLARVSPAVRFDHDAVEVVDEIQQTLTHCFL